jgi:hypothetical protein
MIPTSTALRSSIFGISLWASGVFLVRAFPHLIPPEPSPGLQIALLAAAIPVPYANVHSLPFIGIPEQERLEAMVFGSAVACLMDGVAVGFTDCCSVDAVSKVKVASALLWTFGWGLIIAVD